MPRKNLLITGTAIGLVSVVLMGQTTQVAPVIAPNTPFKVAFNHERFGGEKYRIWCDGAIVKNYSESEVVVTGVSPNQEVTVIIPGLLRGAHSCFASAYIDGVAEEKGMPAIIPVGMVVAVPTQLRVVVEIVK